MTMWNPQQPVYVPRLFRDELSREAKRGAAIGGAVGFGLLTLGWMVVVISVTAAFTVSPIALPGALLGAGFMVLSYIVGRRILIAHRLPRPTGVMVLGSAVGLVASWFIDGALGLTAWLIALGLPDDSRLVLLAITLGLMFVTNVAAGWLGWRWVAHLLRPVAVV